MIVLPPVSAVARPRASTVATDGLLDVQLAEPLTTLLMPLPFKSPNATNWTVSPAVVAEAVEGINVRVGAADAGGVTVMSEVATIPPDWAVIVVLPAPAAVTSPVALTDAAPGLETLQVTPPVMSEVVSGAWPSRYVLMALY